MPSAEIIEVGAEDRRQPNDASALVLNWDRKWLRSKLLHNPEHLYDIENLMADLSEYSQKLVNGGDEVTFFSLGFASKKDYRVLFLLGAICQGIGEE